MIRLAFFGHYHIHTADFNHHLGFSVSVSVNYIANRPLQSNRRRIPAVDSGPSCRVYFSTYTRSNGFFDKIRAGNRSVDE
jgi:hypothetical protein